MDSAAFFEIERSSEWLRIHLRGPRGHALRTEGLCELAEVVENAAADGALPLLISAEAPSFCTGLDLDFACTLDRAGLRALMRAFHQALRAVFLYPAGTVAGGGGPALAGGAILALACDARVVAEGAGRLGIHGIRLGIAYPDVAIEIVRRRFPRAVAEAILYAGQTLAAEEAPVRGWADALVSAEDLLDTARGRLLKMGAGSRVFIENKKRLLEASARRLGSPESKGEERFLDVWFSGPTQQLLATR